MNVCMDRRQTMSDFMELGDSGLVPTPYGFYNIETGEKLDHDGVPLDEDSSEED